MNSSRYHSMNIRGEPCSFRFGFLYRHPRPSTSFFASVTQFVHPWLMWRTFHVLPKRCARKRTFNVKLNLVHSLHRVQVVRKQHEVNRPEVTWGECGEGNLGRKMIFFLKWHVLVYFLIYLHINSFTYVLTRLLTSVTFKNRGHRRKGMF